jgi:hypothetical protein
LPQPLFFNLVSELREERGEAIFGQAVDARRIAASGHFTFTPQHATKVFCRDRNRVVTELFQLNVTSVA